MLMSKALEGSELEITMRKSHALPLILKYKLEPLEIQIKIMLVDI